jgi:predicted Zn-dependent peptidase
MEDLDAASLEDIAEFFRTWYTPNNAVLTIAGDFAPDEAKRLVEEYYGDIPQGGVTPALPSFDVAPSFGVAGTRHVVEDDVKAARAFIALRSPVFGSDEYYAASMLSAILGVRKGSRLYAALVRTTQLASDVGAYTYDLSRGSDLLVVDVMARPEIATEVLEAAVHAELDAVHAHGVTADELARAQALVETDLVRALQSAGARADRLSQFATYLGDPGRLNEEPARYRGVTLAQVNAFAAARLGRENRVTLVYVPRATASVAA